MSTHERFVMASAADRERRDAEAAGQGIEMGNLGTTTTEESSGGRTPTRDEAAPVSPLSTDSRVLPRVGGASPHPGTAVVV